MPSHLLRVVVAALLAIHGVARIALGIVDDFGGFLTATGFPAGLAIAWLLTVVEIFGGIALAAGRWTKWLCAWFIAQLTAGILLVHLRDGWFVVGAGRNGIEYSVLLITCLIVIAWAEASRNNSRVSPPAPTNESS